MRHYLHHLFFDPLGMLDQMLRDTLVTLIIISIIAVVFGILILLRKVSSRSH